MYSEGVESKVHSQRLSRGPEYQDGWQDVFVANVDREVYSLYHNNHDLTFDDLAVPLDIGRLTRLMRGWGVKFFDYDNDGNLDLFLANDHPDDKVEEHSTSVKYKEPFLLLHNNGKGFEDVSCKAGPAFRQAFAARGMAIGDFDNDGGVDVLVAASATSVFTTEAIANGLEGAGIWVKPGLSLCLALTSASRSRVELVLGTGPRPSSASILLIASRKMSMSSAGGVMLATIFFPGCRDRTSFYSIRIFQIISPIAVSLSPAPPFNPQWRLNSRLSSSASLMRSLGNSSTAIFASRSLMKPSLIESCWTQCAAANSLPS